MATKVYLDGDNVKIENPLYSDLIIPQARAKYTFIAAGSTQSNPTPDFTVVKVSDYLTDEYREDLVSNIQNGVGTPIGDYDAVFAYFKTFIFRGDTEIVPPINNPFVSVLNSTTTPLNSGASFTGTSEDVSQYPSVVVACKTDQDCTLYMQFSPDGTNWDSSIPLPVFANVNEVHRLTVTRQYFRIVLTNTSVSNQTFLRLQTIFGNQTSLTSPLNTQIQSDQDSIVTRPLDFNLMVADGLYQNRNPTIKDGITFSIPTGLVTRDVTNEGGAYAGFPTGAVEAGEIIVNGADTGTVYYSYMASSTDTDYTFGSVAIAGAGAYALGHNIWRSNFAYFVANSTTAFNVGTIILRNTVTTTNVFWQIDAGYSQTYCAAYTVPAGSSVYIDRFNGNMRGSANGSLDGFIWYRPSGESPRLRFPFELQFGSLYFDDTDYLIRIPQLVDFIPRIVESSANNLRAKFSYRILKVKS